MDGLLPVVLDCILLLRLATVFPYERTSHAKYAAIMSFPVVMKIARLAAVIVYLVGYAQKLRAALKGNSAGVSSVTIMSSSSSQVAVWSLAVCDNA